MSHIKNLSYMESINKFYIENPDYCNNMNKLSKLLKGEGTITRKDLLKAFIDVDAFSPYADSYAKESSKYNIKMHPSPIIGDKIVYRYCKHDSTQTVLTTESQLLFIKWAIEGGFYSWVASTYKNTIHKNKESTDLITDCLVRNSLVGGQFAHNYVNLLDKINKIADTRTNLDIMYIDGTDIKINLEI